MSRPSAKPMVTRRARHNSVIRLGGCRRRIEPTVLGRYAIDERVPKSLKPLLRRIAPGVQSSREYLIIVAPRFGLTGREVHCRTGARAAWAVAQRCPEGLLANNSIDASARAVTPPASI
jgi:hypothetical protein